MLIYFVTYIKSILWTNIHSTCTLQHKLRACLDAPLRLVANDIGAICFIIVSFMRVSI